MSNTEPTRIDAEGNKYWENSSGYPHRENGPAVVGLNHQYWCINGRYHREDGPSRIYPNWERPGQFWSLDGKDYQENDWKKEVERRKLAGIIKTKEKTECLLCWNSVLSQLL